jgi:copper(I)-binding protein
MINLRPSGAIGACVVALSLVATSALAHGYTLGALRIDHPWSRPTPPGAPTPAGYLTVTNTGATPDRFLDGSTPDAAKIEIHSMSMAGGIMRMRPVADGLALPPRQTIKLEPGSFHLMIIGPKHALKIGEHIPATLRFQHAGEVKVEFYVQAGQPETGSNAPMKMDMH